MPLFSPPSSCGRDTRSWSPPFLPPAQAHLANQKNLLHPPQSPPFPALDFDSLHAAVTPCCEKKNLFQKIQSLSLDTERKTEAKRRTSRVFPCLLPRKVQTKNLQLGKQSCQALELIDGRPPPPPLLPSSSARKHCIRRFSPNSSPPFSIFPTPPHEKKNTQKQKLIGFKSFSAAKQNVHILQHNSSQASILP